MADITPAMVRAAQAWDYENRLRGHPWARVGNGQVRRLIAGALGPDGVVVAAGELVAAALAVERAQAVIKAQEAEITALREQLAAAEVDRDGALPVLDRIQEAHRKRPGCAEFGIVVEEILHRELGCGNDAPEGGEPA